jgi:hypothetical protein
MKLQLLKRQIPSHLLKFFKPVGHKPKDLVNIPHMVAEALREDGWYLRSDIIWHKPNPMPESVTDRCTKSHEYVFMLAKSPTYFYDAEAIRESHQNPEKEDNRSSRRENMKKAAQNGYSTYHIEDHQPSMDQPMAGHPNGRNKRSVWTVSTHSFSEAHFACVDEATECLTLDGWKKYGEIKAGVIAAQFDLATERLSWAAVEDVAVYNVVDEPMVASKSRDVEMLLTPNHRTVIKRRHPDTRQWQPCVVIRADQLKRDHAVPVSGDWDGEWLEPISPEWAELLGWYIAEGCETTRSWSVEIYQSRAANPVKVDRIRELLVAVGAEFLEATAARKWQGRDATMAAFQVQGFAAMRMRQFAPGKEVPRGALSWSNRLLFRLLDGLVDGDGHRRKDGRFCFIQRSRESADMVQAIGVRLGYATMLSRRSEETFVVYFTTKRHISFRGTGGEGAKIGQRPYTGVIWCPKLPLGTWVARKSGRAFVTGNTFPPKLIEPMILAATSERGCCPACGSPYRRVVERERVATRPGEKTKVKVPSGWDTKPGSHGTIHREGRTPDPEYRDAAEVGNRDPERHVTSTRTVGWEPGCDCNAPGEPLGCVVLDPFSGAGTVAMVSLRLGRRFIGSELNESYCEMARKRIQADMPLFA